MGKRAVGNLVIDERSPDTGFNGRFRWRGSRIYLSIGRTSDGWTRERALEEIGRIQAAIDAGTWRPPSHIVKRHVRAADVDGWIYFIGARDGQGEWARIKIGWAELLPRRMVDIETASPWPLRVLGALPGTQRDEAQMHRTFARDRLHGEWFSASDSLLAVALCGVPIAALRPWRRSARLADAA